MDMKCPKTEVEGVSRLPPRAYQPVAVMEPTPAGREVAAPPYLLALLEWYRSRRRLHRPSSPMTTRHDAADSYFPSDRTMIDFASRPTPAGCPCTRVPRKPGANSGRRAVPKCCRMPWKRDKFLIPVFTDPARRSESSDASFVPAVTLQ